MIISVLSIPFTPTAPLLGGSAQEVGRTPSFDSWGEPPRKFAVFRLPIFHYIQVKSHLYPKKSLNPIKHPLNHGFWVPHAVTYCKSSENLGTGPSLAKRNHKCCNQCPSSWRLKDFINTWDLLTLFFINEPFYKK